NRANCARNAERCSGVGLNRKRIPVTSAVSASTEPARQIGDELGGPVERRNYFADEPSVSLPVTAKSPTEGLAQGIGAQHLWENALVQPPRRKDLGADLL